MEFSASRTGDWNEWPRCERWDRNREVELSPHLGHIWSVSTLASPAYTAILSHRAQKDQKTSTSLVLHNSKYNKGYLRREKGNNVVDLQVELSFQITTCIF